MYNNIGKKIKMLAKVIFFVEAIAAIFGGISVIGLDEDLAVVGILIMIVGSVFAWVSSWLLYGFGEIIDKLSDIEQNTRTGVKSYTPVSDGVDRLSKIEKLRSEGLITEEEYRQSLSKSSS